MFHLIWNNEGKRIRNDEVIKQFVYLVNKIVNKQFFNVNFSHNKEQYLLINVKGIIVMLLMRRRLIHGGAQLTNASLNTEMYPTIFTYSYM